MRLTPKQVELLNIIQKANPDGTLIDMDELLERASYKPTKESMHFSIRALIVRGLIEKGDREKRRHAVRATFRILPLGQHMIIHVAPSVYVSSVEEDADLAALESLV